MIRAGIGSAHASGPTCRVSIRRSKKNTVEKRLRHCKGSKQMANLKNSKTEGNLKAAFAGESQANRRNLYFAQKADLEGYDDVADWFETLAKAEMSHAGRFQKALDTLG